VPARLLAPLRPHALSEGGQRGLRAGAGCATGPLRREKPTSFPRDKPLLPGGRPLSSEGLQSQRHDTGCGFSVLETVPAAAGVRRGAGGIRPCDGVRDAGTRAGQELQRAKAESSSGPSAPASCQEARRLFLCALGNTAPTITQPATRDPSHPETLLCSDPRDCRRPSAMTQKRGVCR